MIVIRRIKTACFACGMKAAGVNVFTKLMLDLASCESNEQAFIVLRKYDKKVSDKLIAIATRLKTRDRKLRLLCDNLIVFVENYKKQLDQKFEL